MMLVYISTLLHCRSTCTAQLVPVRGHRVGDREVIKGEKEAPRSITKVRYILLTRKRKSTLRSC